jgi:hypothetical protein
MWFLIRGLSPPFFISCSLGCARGSPGEVSPGAAPVDRLGRSRLGLRPWIAWEASPGAAPVDRLGRSRLGLRPWIAWGGLAWGCARGLPGRSRLELRPWIAPPQNPTIGCRHARGGRVSPLGQRPHPTRLSYHHPTVYAASYPAPVSRRRESHNRALTVRKRSHEACMRPDG